MPHRGDILDTLGWAYLQSGMLTEAEEILRQAVALAPNHPSIRYHLGVAQYRLGRKAEAASELRRALQICGSFPEASKAREILKAAEG